MTHGYKMTHDADYAPVTIGELIDQMRADAPGLDEAAAGLDLWGAEVQEFTGIADTERALVSGLMSPRGGAEARGKVSDLGLKPGNFFRSAFGAVFEAVLAVDAAGDPVDALTVVAWLHQSGRLAAVGGAVEVSRIEAAIGSAAHCEAYARIVLSEHHRRATHAAGLEMAARSKVPGSVAELVTFATDAVASILDDDANGELWSGGEWMSAFTDRLEKLHNGEIEQGLTTGLKDFDALVGGMCAGDLVILAARPSMGKTSMASTIADAVVHSQKKKVLFFSAEMPHQQIAMRQVAIRSGIPLTRLGRGQPNRDEWAALARAVGEITESDGLTVVDAPMLSIEKIRSVARRQHAKGRCDAIIVDQITAMDLPGAPGMTKADAVGEISKGLKQLARELQIPVIALAQLNRGVESRTDKRPMMSDLRDSGALEQDADKVVFLYRDEYYLKDKTPEDKLGIAEIIVSKNRDGPTGVAYVRFFPELAHFRDRARHDPASGY